jgi:hypothetical protein
MASPGRAPRPAAAAGRRPVFPFFGRECRILVRAHGSVAPGSSCPGGDSHSSPGRSRSGSLQESIAASLPHFRLWFSPAPRGRGSTVNSSSRDGRLCPSLRRVRPSANHDSQSESPSLADQVGHCCSADTIAAISPWRRGPSWRCHFGPFARRHQHEREDDHSKPQLDAMKEAAEQLPADRPGFIALQFNEVSSADLALPHLRERSALLCNYLFHATPADHVAGVYICAFGALSVDADAAAYPAIVIWNPRFKFDGHGLPFRVGVSDAAFAKLVSARNMDTSAKPRRMKRSGRQRNQP